MASGVSAAQAGDHAEADARVWMLLQFEQGWNSTRIMQMAESDARVAQHAWIAGSLALGRQETRQPSVALLCENRLEPDL